MTDLSLTVTREIAAPIEAVYNAWLDPAMLAKFMIPGNNMTVPAATVDAREGGRFDIVMAAGDQKMPHGGVYKTLKPFTQIIFTWESAISVEGSTVTLNFSESHNKTIVELIHIKFADEQSCSNHNDGWTSILTHLDNTLSEI